MKILRYLPLLLVTTMLFSCREKNKFSDVDLSGMALDSFRFERLDIAYRDIDTNNVAGSLATLKGRYGDYLNLFSERVLNVGHIDSVSTHTVIRQFLSHPEYRKIFMACDSVYKDGFAKEESEITDAFKYFKYYFPEKKIPERIIVQMSGFGQNAAVTEDALAISLEYYLGTEYPAYKQYMYDYMIPNCKREKLVSDLMYAWIQTEFENAVPAPKLIDVMVYEGKLHYLLEVMLPKTKKDVIMGYTKEQWDWCKANEGAMWHYIAENKHLFSTDRLDLSKYTGLAPKTAYFPDESPSRTGIWIGWQIVKEYIKNNPDVTLDKLMETDAQTILSGSKYNPK